MPADQFKARSSTRLSGADRDVPDVVPDLFDSRGEKLPSSGQVSAGALAGLVMFAFELLVAWQVFLTTLGVSLLMWWLLDQPWSGRRRKTRRRGITSRLLYLSTLLLIGMWLAVMFIFRASDPTLSAAFSTTLPSAFMGQDIAALAALNGMGKGTAKTSANNSPVVQQQSSVEPFSLFAHGMASTIAISLLAYAVVSGRRRVRRRVRDDALTESRAQLRHRG